MTNTLAYTVVETTRGKGDQIARLLRHVSRLGDAVSEDAAIDTTLGAICSAIASPLGFAHVLDSDGGLRTRHAVDVDAPAVACSSEREAAGCPNARDARLQRILLGEGVQLLGRCGPDGSRGETQCPVLRVFVPIVAGAEVLGAIEVFISSWQEVTNEMTEALLNAGAHLGRTLDHFRLMGEVAEARHASTTFAARAVHELRNPVATATLALSSLVRRHDRLNDHDRELLLAIANRSMVQLRGLLDRLTDLVEAGDNTTRVDVHPVPLAKVLSDLINDLALAHGRAIVLQCPDDLIAQVDDIALHEIVDNLVTNAVRHGGPTISVIAEKVRDQVTLTVVDDGAGVPAEISESLFEPLVRGGDRSPGFGLGLAISRQLARSCGGDLEHRAGDPHGAHFMLTLPGALS